MGSIKTLYYTFKEDYNEFSESFNIFKQINKKIKEKEDKYIVLLDELNDNINNTINNEETNKKIQLTNGILDLLIDYDSIIYKMNNGYEAVDDEKLNIMLEKINNL